MFQKTLFIFRRDLRLQDNTGLIHGLENSKVVIPCFIFTPEQIEKNEYKSNRSLQFLIESLEDLDESLKEYKSHLYLFYQQPEMVITRLIKEEKIDCVIVNRDYTPYSISRDEKIKKVCEQHHIPFLSFDDALLTPPENSLKKDGTPYKVFTPYFRHACTLGVDYPQTNLYSNYYQKAIIDSETKDLFNKLLPQRFTNNLVKGGRKEGEKLLKLISDLSKYSYERDFPILHATSKLSPYLKFTVFSPREVYLAIKDQFTKYSDIIRSLYWRDFFTTIGFYFPHVYQGSFKPEYDKINWNHSEKDFKKWCEGKTGFPIVDAGMRELNETGYMHNRVRMVVASFLTKDLHIDWRKGERYFAQHLIDYDPALNNGNWQWAASTGCDAQPYFRIFNPWNQQKKFDEDAKYIKLWVPELRSYSAKVIHDWNENELFWNTYYEPMVQHDVQSKKAIQMYREV